MNHTRTRAILIIGKSLRANTVVADGLLAGNLDKYDVLVKHNTSELQYIADSLKYTIREHPLKMACCAFMSLPTYTAIGMLFVLPATLSRNYRARYSMIANPYMSKSLYETLPLTKGQTPHLSPPGTIILDLETKAQLEHAMTLYDVYTIRVVETGPESNAAMKENDLDPFLTDMLVVSGDGEVSEAIAKYPKYFDYVSTI